MDITRFNQELAGKVAKAKRFERQNDIKRAIESWLEISEMAINFSKNPRIESTFRNMLISKTEQIFQHIRDLKTPKKKVVIKEEFKLPEVISTEIISPVDDTPISSSEDVEPKGLADDNWMDMVDFKEAPGGVVEIEPPKDFKIATPHDPNYIEKIKKASEENHMGGLMQREKPKIKNVDNGTKVFCFACGAEIQSGAKICSECGTQLG